MRDSTLDGSQTNAPFYYNLFCLAKDPQIAGSVVHFPGQYGVDLDVHILAPAAPQIEKDHWDWKQYIGRWGTFTEEQYGIRIMKHGSSAEFFTVLYPRAAGQGPAQMTPLANGRAVEVRHMEGTDLVLLSSGQDAAVASGGATLAGEIAFARRYANGDLRLAVVKGANTAATLDAWTLRSSGPVAIEIKGLTVSGESSGAAHAAQITLPPAFEKITVTLDDKPAQSKREGNRLTIALPDGNHTFMIKTK